MIDLKVESLHKASFSYGVAALLSMPFVGPLFRAEDSIVNHRRSLHERSQRDCEETIQRIENLRKYHICSLVGYGITALFMPYFSVPVRVAFGAYSLMFLYYHGKRLHTFLPTELGRMQNRIADLQPK